MTETSTENPIVLAQNGAQVVFPMPQMAQPSQEYGYVLPPDPADHVPMPVAEADAYDAAQSRKIDQELQEQAAEQEQNSQSVPVTEPAPPIPEADPDKTSSEAWEASQTAGAVGESDVINAGEPEDFTGTTVQ